MNAAAKTSKGKNLAKRLHFFKRQDCTLYKFVNSAALSTIFPLIYFFLLALLALAPTQAIAAGSLADSIIVRAEGRATLAEGGDIDAAKAQALAAAKADAALKVAAQYVSRDVLVAQKRYLLKIFQPQADVIVEETKIITQRQEKGFCHVEIEAKANKVNIKNLLLKNLIKKQAIVITSEKNLGKPSKSRILAQELSQKIKKNGYRIVNCRTADKTVSAAGSGNNAAMRKAGLYCLTDIVIVASAETAFSEQTMEIYSAHAKGQIKIIKTGEDKELAAVMKTEVKGFGSGKEKAGIDALKKIAVELSNVAVKVLPQKQK